jgi:hypothetical protein
MAGQAALPLAAAFRIARGTASGMLPQMIATDKIASNAVAKTAEIVGGIKGRTAQLAAMSVVLEDLSNYARKNAPFTDRTGQLRRSYVTEVIQSGHAIIGIFGNVTVYAPYVEYTPGYWVLSGAITAREPFIKEMLGDELTIERVMGS